MEINVLSNCQGDKNLVHKNYTKTITKYPFLVLEGTSPIVEDYRKTGKSIKILTQKCNTKKVISLLKHFIFH